jgi:processive 1,2-diacylglycerol beta-glucosyltransferase
MTNPGKKIFILYSTGDSGHYSAAQSLKTAFKKNYPSLEIILVNTLAFISPTLKNFIHSLYIFFIKSSRKIYDRLWGNQAFYRKANPISKIFLALTYRKFKTYYDKHKPDAVICTQVVPCAVFSAIKRKYAGKLKLFAVITDYDIHPFWYIDNIDGFFIATEAIKEKLLQRNIPADKIIASGIPIDPDFSKKLSEAEEAKRVFKDKKPNVLLMAGSMGVGPLDQIARDLDKLDIDFKLYIVCGRNKRLENKINKMSLKFKHEVEVYGFISNIIELMSKSSLLITKPGGLTSSEALAMRLPMIIYSSVGGQESRNVDYLCSRNAAWKAFSPREIPEAAKTLLTDQALAEEFSYNAAKISKPEAADIIVKTVLKSI